MMCLYFEILLVSHCTGITRQLIKLESCSNYLKMQEVF